MQQPRNVSSKKKLPFGIETFSTATGEKVPMYTFLEAFTKVKDNYVTIVYPSGAEEDVKIMQASTGIAGKMGFWIFHKPETGYTQSFYGYNEYGIGFAIVRPVDYE